MILITTRMTISISSKAQKIMDKVSYKVDVQRKKRENMQKQ